MRSALSIGPRRARDITSAATVKKPNWNTTRFRRDEGSGRPAPARTGRSPVEDNDRRLLRRSVALFALLVIVTGAYILLRTQPSGAIDISAGVEQQATAQIAAAATDAATQVAVALAPADTEEDLPTASRQPRPWRSGP